MYGVVRGGDVGEVAALDIEGAIAGEVIEGDADVLEHEVRIGDVEREAECLAISIGNNFGANNDRGVIDGTDPDWGGHRLRRELAIGDREGEARAAVDVLRGDEAESPLPGSDAEQDAR